MARSVPPWLWMVLARDHAPANSSVRLVLHTIRSFMDDTGYTFVGQSTIAESSCLAKPTVRKALEIAWREKWIGIALHERAGKAWRHYEYRACIPDSLHVPSVHEALVETWASQHGDVDTENHPDIRKVGKPVSHLTPDVGNPVAHLNGENASSIDANECPIPEGGQTEEPKVGKSTTERGQIEASKVGKVTTPKSSSEKLSSKLSPEEGPALSRSTSLVRMNGRSNPEEPPETRIAKATQLMKATPDIPNATIGRMYKLTDSEVDQIRRQIGESSALP